MSFYVDNPLELLEQSGLVGVTLNDNAAPAANILYSSLKSSSSAATPATATSLGTIQLSGALTGTATNPQLAAGSVSSSQIAPGAVGSTQIAPGAVGTSQLANGSVTAQQVLLGGPSELLGSNSTSNAGQNITLNPATLTMSASGVLSAIPASPATTTSLGTVQLAGDLGGVGTTATAPVITNNAVTYAKMQKIANANALLGNSTNTANSNVGEVIVGPGLSLSNPVGELTINPSTIPLPPATTTTQGTVILSGLSGSPPSDLTESTPGVPIIAANAVTYPKIQKAVGADVLLGNPGAADSNYQEVSLLAGGGLEFSGTALGVNLGSITTGSPLQVSEGGTGDSTLTGYLKGNGTSPITGSSTIPATAITPNLVGSVNGVSPSSAGGNVAVTLGTVSTGILADLPAQPQPNGDIYVVSGDPTPSNDGLTYISTGSAWEAVTSNLATTDARYVQLAGSTMSANATLAFPSTGQITLAQTTFASDDAITQGAVTTQIAAAVAAGAPPATTTSTGLIQLGANAFDPSSTATDPVLVKASTTFGAIQLPASPGTPATNSLVEGASPGIALIAPGAVSLSQMANLSGTSQLLGSSSTSSAATDITLGTGLSMSGSTLNVLPGAVPAATTTSLGTVQLAGDLGGTGTTATAPVITNNAVTYAKMQKAVGSNVVIGAQTAGSNLGELTVGSGLVVGPSSLGLAPLSGVSELLGSGTGSTAATNISLGTGLQMTGTTLSLNQATTNALYQTLQPSAVTGDVAVFNGSGQTIDSGVDISNGVTTPSTDVLVTYNEIMNQNSNAFYTLYTPSINIGPNATVAIFSGGGVANIGPQAWPVSGSNDRTSFSDVLGTIGIKNPDTESKTYRITCYTGLLSTNGPASNVTIAFMNPTQFSPTGLVMCLPTSFSNPQLSTSAIITMTVTVSAGSTYNFSVVAINNTSNVSFLGGTGTNNSNMLVIERIC